VLALILIEVKGGEDLDRIRPSKSVFLLYLVPITLFFSFVVIVPILYALYYSFFEWSGGPLRTFNGLENFRTLIADEIFWLSFRNNVYITVLCMIGQIGIAYVFAMMLSTRVAKLKGIHRTLCYFPVTLSAVVIGFIWSMIYDYRFGMLNALLRSAGHGDLQQAWLSNNDWVLTFASIPVVWQYIGLYMVIFLAAFTAVDKHVIEMSEIDGANGFQRMVLIMMPLMKHTFVVALILCISGNMKIFDHIFVMTSGGPGNATMVMAMYAYNVSFLRHNLGYGNAISIGILVLSFVIILGVRGIMRLATKDQEVEV